MQLLSTPSAFFVKGEKTVLRCCRRTGQLTVVEHSVLASEKDVHSVPGDVQGVLGTLHADGSPYLLVVVATTAVAKVAHTQKDILRIDRIVAVPVADDGRIDTQLLQHNGGIANGLDKLRSQPKKLLKLVSDRSTPSAAKLIDDVVKLVNDSGNFYFSIGHDLTSCTQRSVSRPGECDERFFWNRALLADLFDAENRVLPGHAEWVVPVIYGYVNQKDLSFEADSQPLTLTLISRRSRHRAGCRYLRRGVDEEGNVANFVETELVLRIFSHCLSFVQIRGSVPIFWSQKGYRYRPPLTIDRPLSDSLPPFKAHLEKLVEDYGSPAVIVNLVNQTGRELGLADAFLQHILELDSDDLGYYSFDFHYHCRALNFTKVQTLISALEPQLSKIGFCWVDKCGVMVRQQQGVIRTNCVDCLDRTNVVQSAISQAVCFTQARKLGLIDPTSDTPEALLSVLQILWADHGDCISRQYAGTDALKGDVTRSGQRKLLGLMKDGYNSASRYYLCHVRDAYRQRAIDTFVSGIDTAAHSTVSSVKDTEEDADESENIGRLVHETVRFVLPEGEVLVGGWALVDGGSSTDQIDTVLLLTRSHIYIAVYGEDTEKLEEVKTVSFGEIQRLELGELSKSPRIHMRIYWRPSKAQPDHNPQSSESNASVQYSSWRAAKTRLFNNVAIAIKSDEEADEYVNAIAEQLRVTIGMCTSKEIPLTAVRKLSGPASNKSRTFLTNMLTSAFKLRNRGRATEKPVGASAASDNAKPGSTAPTIEFDSLASSRSNSPDRDSIRSGVSANATSTTASNGGEHSLVASTIPQSKSDCHLMASAPGGNSRCEAASGPAAASSASGFSLINKLQSKMKATPLWKSSSALADDAGVAPPSVDKVSVAAADPFQKYKERILQSKSHIIML